LLGISLSALDNGNKPVLSYGTGCSINDREVCYESKTLLLIAILALVVVPVRATIPLVEELSLQLPPCTAWDVQHWMDTNTFGYAYLRADTVYWAAHVGDTEQAFVIPDSFYNPHGEFGSPTHEWIRILRHPRAGDRPCILLTSSAWTVYAPDDYYFVSLYDILANTNLGVQQFLKWTTDYNLQRRCEIRDLTLWPPPPTTATRFLFSHYVIDDYDWNVGHRGLDEYGSIMQSDLTRDTFALQTVCSGTSAKVFAAVSNHRFAIMDYHYWEYQDYYGTTARWSRIVKSFYPPAQISDINSDSIYYALWAQTDGNGMQRIIVDYGIWWRSSTIAINPDNGDTLWRTNQIIGGDVARIAGSADERILHGNAVYDAANGAYLDNMGSMLGSLKYIIRQPNSNSDFVTYEDASRTVRVYTSLPPVPNRVTCSFAPETGMLRLRWQATPRAVRYWIYASSAADGQYWPIDHVDVGATSYDISPASPHRFFQVTAEY
jgi:hypothetical protein